jgi:hypothetical protein
MIYLIASLLIFFSYTTYIIIKYGIQRSISASYHKLTIAEKWMFTLSTWGYVMPIVLAGVGQSTWQDILLLFAGFLLCTVGVMASDKAPEQKKWHTIGAEGGILLALLWAITTPAWFVVIPGIGMMYMLFKTKPANHTWWIETIAYYSLVLATYLLLR